MKHLIIALAVAGLSIAGMDNTAQAQPQVKIAPSPAIAPQAPPQLGFMGQMEWDGIRVLNVFWNTPAKRIGLEPGDKIVKVNGIWIRSIQQYQFALGRYNGSVNLLVQDVRTGRYVSANGWVPMNNGPVLYNKSQPMPAIKSVPKGTKQKGNF